MYKAGIITASDKGSQGLREDKGGPAIREILSGFADTFEVVDYRIVPDEKVRLTSAMIDMADIQKIDLIVTTGGTGFSKRDVTPEATLEVIERRTPGIPEAMRSISLAVTMELCSPARKRAFAAIPSSSIFPAVRKLSKKCSLRFFRLSNTVWIFFREKTRNARGLSLQNKETDRSRVRARKRSDPVS